MDVHELWDEPWEGLPEEEGCRRGRCRWASYVVRRISSQVPLPNSARVFHNGGSGARALGVSGCVRAVSKRCCGDRSFTAPMANGLLWPGAYAVPLTNGILGTAVKSIHTVSKRIGGTDCRLPRTVSKRCFDGQAATSPIATLAGIPYNQKFTPGSLYVDGIPWQSNGLGHV